MTLIKLRNLDSKNLVIEIGSNDGYMLKNFHEIGIPVLGIDPAEGPAQAAEKRGIQTLCTFFEEKLAKQLKEEGRLADVVITNNTLNQILPNLNSFVESIKIILKDI